MVIVGVECTAHTFGVGVVRDGKVLANVRDMYTTEEGGIIPSESAEHHEKVADQVWAEALKEAGVAESEIEGIAVSNAPGLAPCLHVGVKFASERAKKLGVPLVGVNHCVAHLEIGQSVGAKDPVLLYASGANTQVVAFSNGKYRVFGETLDLGIGNFLDKLAREMGFGFPGGPEIEKKAKDGDYMELPYSIKGMDVSFSGMGTKVKQLLSKGVSIDATRSFRSSGTNNQGHDKVVRNLCFSVQETAFAMLVEAAERALAHTGKKELVLGGGVGCNARLQEMCEKMCADRGAEFFCPERGLLVDNGAMIAYLGEVMLRAEKEKGGRKFSKPGDTDVLVVKPRERTDHVKVTWR